VESKPPINGGKMGGRKLRHKHALPIDSPIILDALFAFRLRTCPASFSAVSFEKVLDSFIKANRETAQNIELNKNQILAI
jgi:hypothetical protein